MLDLRRLRLSNITSPEFSHLILALFWPLFGLGFWALEEFRPAEDCHEVWCPLDDLIPFDEMFFIPYLFWFVFLVGMNVYLALFDPAAFRRFMRFIILTYGTALVVYAVYPTCQNLRPVQFPRDNALTRAIGKFYAFDTNTNVCPSLHTVGSLAVAFGAWDTKRFQSVGWKTLFMATALLISFSTVFVKQHSIIDMFAGMALSAIAYWLVYRRQETRNSYESHGQLCHSGPERQGAVSDL